LQKPVSAVVLCCAVVFLLIWFKPQFKPYHKNHSLNHAWQKFANPAELGYFFSGDYAGFACL